MKKLVIVVDKRGFGVYPCSQIVVWDKLCRDKHCEIIEREKMIIS